MRLLFDTSALIELERKEPKAVAAMKKFTTDELFVPAIAATEFYTGAAFITNKKLKRQSHELLASFTILPFTWFMAFDTAEIRARAIKRKHYSGLADEAIAGTFVNWEIDLLITQNKKHFAEIPELKGKVKSFSEL